VLQNATRCEVSLTAGDMNGRLTHCFVRISVQLAVTCPWNGIVANRQLHSSITWG